MALPSVSALNYKGDRLSLVESVPPCERAKNRGEPRDGVRAAHSLSKQHLLIKKVVVAHQQTDADTLNQVPIHDVSESIKERYPLPLGPMLEGRAWSDMRAFAHVELLHSEIAENLNPLGLERFPLLRLMPQRCRGSRHFRTTRPSKKLRPPKPIRTTISTLGPAQTFILDSYPSSMAPIGV